jgi:hypothetical protein
MSLKSSKVRETNAPSPIPIKVTTCSCVLGSRDWIRSRGTVEKKMPLLRTTVAGQFILSTVVLVSSKPMLN